MAGLRGRGQVAVPGWGGSCAFCRWELLAERPLSGRGVVAQVYTGSLALSVFTGMSS